jgi:hypothetical protein
MQADDLHLYGVMCDGGVSIRRRVTCSAGIAV